MQDIFLLTRFRRKSPEFGKTLKNNAFICVRQQPANFCYPAEGEYDDPLPVRVSLSSQPHLILQLRWPVLSLLEFESAGIMSVSCR